MSKTAEVNPSLEPLLKTPADRDAMSPAMQRGFEKRAKNRVKKEEDKIWDQTGSAFKYISIGAIAIFALIAFLAILAALIPGGIVMLPALGIAAGVTAGTWLLVAAVLIPLGHGIRKASSISESKAFEEEVEQQRTMESGAVERKQQKALTSKMAAIDTLLDSAGLLSKMVNLLESDPLGGGVISDNNGPIDELKERLTKEGSFYDILKAVLRKEISRKDFKSYCLENPEDIESWLGDFRDLRRRVVNLRDANPNYIHEVRLQESQLDSAEKVQKIIDNAVKEQRTIDEKAKELVETTQPSSSAFGPPTTTKAPRGYPNGVTRDSFVQALNQRVLEDIARVAPRARSATIYNEFGRDLSANPRDRDFLSKASEWAQSCKGTILARKGDDKYAGYCEKELAIFDEGTAASVKNTEEPVRRIFKAIAPLSKPDTVAKEVSARSIAKEFQRDSARSNG